MQSHIKNSDTPNPSTMNIYFAGSIRGGRVDKEIYLEIIRYLSTQGKVLTEHIGDPGLDASGEDGPSDRYIYERDVEWLEAADAVVAEVSTPSLGVGYELGWAESHGKPILCLYRRQPERKLSAMVSGNSSLQVAYYESLDQARVAIDRFLKGIFPKGM
jgi:2'-deoxynucleoside 5'-phosphate N-hydrolase